jgi:hypothetical protein
MIVVKLYHYYYYVHHRYHYMDFLYNFFQTCDRSHYFKGIIAIDRVILYTISFKLAISPIISKKLLLSIALFSVQFLSNLRSVPLFQRNYCDRSSYSLYNFKGPAIDRSKFSKELCDRSNLKATTVQFLKKLQSIGPNFQRNWAIDRLSFC